MTLLARLAVRTLVLSVVYAVALVALETSESTDPLGAGLLIFLVFVLIALAWGVVDGRRGLGGQAVVVWLLAGGALGVVTSVVIAVQDSDAGALGSDLAASVPFFALMIGIPAAVGVGIGALLGAILAPSR